MYMIQKDIKKKQLISPLLLKLYYYFILPNLF